MWDRHKPTCPNLGEYDGEGGLWLPVYRGRPNTVLSFKQTLELATVLTAFASGMFLYYGSLAGKLGQVGL
jgi:hypothetical protein